MIKFRSLNQNKEFLKILKKQRINTKYFTVYFNKNSKHFKNGFNKYLNISFVMKKKIGNAVIRNKIKRKLKYAVQKVLKEKQPIDLNYTYVIFGKNNVYKDKFVLILNEMNMVFEKIIHDDIEKTNLVIINSDSVCICFSKNKSNMITEYQEKLWKVEKYNKPLKAISNYKIKELKIIAQKLCLNIESMKKKEIYSEIKQNIEAM